MLLSLSVAIMQVTVSVAIMPLEVSSAFMQMTVSVAKVWVTVFIVIMQVGVPVAIIQVVTILYSIYQLTPTFHKIDWEIFKGIISGLNFTTFVNVFPKLRHFKGRNLLKESFSTFVFLIVL